MEHRHLDVAPRTPARELGLAALDDLLERGDLADWRPVLQEIAHDPWGPVADRVLQLVDKHPLPGTSGLWRSWVNRHREGSSGAIHAGAALRELRLSRGLTQQQLAVRLETTQPEISKLERRRDVRVSTLRAYVAGLGGQLRLSASFPDQDTAIG